MQARAEVEPALEARFHEILGNGGTNDNGLRDPCAAEEFTVPGGIRREDLGAIDLSTTAKYKLPKLQRPTGCAFAEVVDGRTSLDVAHVAWLASHDVGPPLNRSRLTFDGDAPALWRIRDAHGEGSLRYAEIEAWTST
jgi:hypothetical protein